MPTRAPLAWHDAVSRPLLWRPSRTPVAGLPTIKAVISRTPDPCWPAPDGHHPEGKKARTKPRKQQQHEAPPAAPPPQQQQQQPEQEQEWSDGAGGEFYESDEDDAGASFSAAMARAGGGSKAAGAKSAHAGDAGKKRGYRK
jgi:hypothetical protein